MQQVEGEGGVGELAAEVAQAAGLGDRKAVGEEKEGQQANEVESGFGVGVE
jgi:hypothetical protein